MPAVKPGWVVLTDVWYPGWEATVDGANAPILPAYHVYRAVHIESGTHTIAMRFRPASFTSGLWLSALSVAGALIALLLIMFRRRRVKPLVSAG